MIGKLHTDVFPVEIHKIDKKLTGMNKAAYRDELVLYCRQLDVMYN